MTDTQTLTLVSHAGSGAAEPYGPVRHEAVTGAVDLVSWRLPADPGQEPGRLTLVDIDGELWSARPLQDALGGVEVDGDVVRFDGALPYDGSCHGPVFRLDADRFYRPFTADVPVVVVEQMRRVFGGTFPAARIDHLRLEGLDLPWDLVRGRRRDMTRRDAREGLPGADDERVVLTLFEVGLLPDELRSSLDLVVHDETAARALIDPVVLLTALVERRRADAVAARDRAQAVVDRMTAAVEDGVVPGAYRVPSSGTESVYDAFCSSGRAVDHLLATRAALDLFSRPPRRTW